MRDDVVFRSSKQILNEDFKKKLSEALSKLTHLTETETDQAFVSRFTACSDDFTLPSIREVQILETEVKDDQDRLLPETGSGELIDEHLKQDRNYQYERDFSKASFTTRHKDDITVKSECVIESMQPALEFVKSELKDQPYCIRSMDGVIRLLSRDSPGENVAKAAIKEPKRFKVSHPFTIVHFTSHVKFLNALEIQDECYVAERQLHCHTDLDSSRWMFSLERELEPGTLTTTYKHLKQTEWPEQGSIVPADANWYGNETVPIRKCLLSGEEGEEGEEFFFPVNTERGRGYDRYDLGDGTSVKVGPSIEDFFVPPSHQARVFIRAEQSTTMLRDGGAGGLVSSFDTNGGEHVCLPVGTKMRLVKKEPTRYPVVGQGYFFVGDNYLFDLIE